MNILEQTMRKFAITALGSILCSCVSHREQERTDSISQELFPIADSIQYTGKESPAYTDDCTLSEMAKSKVDTVVLNNGLHAIRIFEFGPMNECIIFKEKSGLPVAIVSHASETDAQILTFSYGSKGRISSVREYYLDILEWDMDLESLLGFVSGNEAAYKYSFIHNDEGRLTEISRKDNRPESKGRKIIKASDGNHLEGDFRPVEDYWASDLHGGRLDLYCRELPNDITIRNDTSHQWINFQPVSGFGDAPAVPEEFFGEPKAIPF